MNLKQNINNLIKDIESDTNLILTICEHNNGYMLDIYKVASDETLEPIKKRYDDLLGHYKYLRGMYETIKMLELEDLELI